MNGECLYLATHKVYRERSRMAHTAMLVQYEEGANILIINPLNGNISIQQE